MTTVSYTHLDVYKRQERTSTTLTDMDMNYLLLYLEENYVLTSEKKVQLSLIHIFALPEAKPPVIQPVQIIGNQRVEGRVGRHTFFCATVVWIPVVKPCFRCRYGAENTA